MRIVSLLPSATEILFALGFDKEIVGVSHECDFPEQARTKRVVIHSRLPHDAAPAEIDGWSASMSRAARVFIRWMRKRSRNWRRI